MICYDCAMGTDDRKEEASRQFSLQIDACGDAAVIGSEVGPYPLNKEVMQ
jgi:hypothetical protein